MCTFCDLGICHDPAHRSGANAGETPVLLFDVRRSRPSPRDTQAPPPRRGILVDTRVSPLGRTHRHPTQAQEAQIISGILGSPMGVTHAIPKNIHRFWTGGPMRPAVVEELIADGVRAKQAGWTCYLWYSSEVERVLDAHLDGEINKTKGVFLFSKRPPMPVDKRPLRATQRQKLKLAGYQVLPIERFDTGDESLTALANRAGRSALSGNWDDVKYFSDLARLLYLYFVGGIHMDVDIALGDMDLTAQYFHNDPAGQVPLMGSLLRDQSDPMIPKLRYLKRIRQQPTLTQDEHEEYMEALGALVEKGMLAAGMLNALIASRPGTAHLKDTIDELRQRIEDDGGFISGMALSRTLLFGRTRTGNLDQTLKWTVPPYLVRLDPDTDESNH